MIGSLSQRIWEAGVRELRVRVRDGGALVWGIGLLLVLEAGLIVANVWRIPDLWRLGEEGSLPTYLHTGVLFGGALVFWSVFAASRRARVEGLPAPRRLGLWLFGGVGLAYLGLDEAFQLHERSSRFVFEAIGIQDRIAHYEVTPALWEALFAPVFAVIGLLIMGAMFQERRRAPLAFLLGIAAMGIWGTALLTEFVEMTYFIEEEFWFGAAIWLEESTELLGSTTFLIASLVMADRLGALGQLAPRTPAREPATA